MSKLSSLNIETVAAIANDSDLFTFTVDFIYPSLEKLVSYPIYAEDNGSLVGFFSYKELNRVRCVIDPKLKPLSLFISSGQNLFFTMVQDKNNQDYYCGIVSEAPVDNSSIKVSF